VLVRGPEAQNGSEKSADVAHNVHLNICTLVRQARRNFCRSRCLRTVDIIIAVIAVWLAHNFFAIPAGFFFWKK
jgi:hypothetical protein